MSTFITLAKLVEEWGVSRDYARSLIRREEDPLPMRLLPGKERGYVASVSELDEWFSRNAR